MVQCHVCNLLSNCSGKCCVCGCVCMSVCRESVHWRKYNKTSQLLYGGEGLWVSSLVLCFKGSCEFETFQKSKLKGKRTHANPAAGAPPPSWSRMRFLSGRLHISHHFSCGLCPSFHHRNSQPLLSTSTMPGTVLSIVLMLTRLLQVTTL